MIEPNFDELKMLSEEFSRRTGFSHDYARLDAVCAAAVE
jgi:hypothetical protein